MLALAILTNWSHETHDGLGCVSPTDPDTPLCGIELYTALRQSQKNPTLEDLVSSQPESRLLQTPNTSASIPDRPSQPPRTPYPLPPLPPAQSASSGARACLFGSDSPPDV